MILILLVIGALGFFLSMIYTKRLTSRIILSIISLVILIGSITLMVLNDHNHLGLTEEMTTTTQRIYSATGKQQLPVILYQPIGTKGDENVYIYKNSENGKTIHTQANEDTHNKVLKTSSVTPKLKTVEVRRVYTKNWAKLLFNWSNNNHQLVKRTNTIELPASWMTLTTKQMKQLGKAMAGANSSGAKQQQQMAAQQFVEGKVAAEKVKNPNMTAEQQTQVMQKAQDQFKSQMLQKALQAK